ncbi:tetratricopeptide repeat protein [Rhodoferax sp. WC2427]|uniref:tetratricopeptide repeat protein n=1 Tax=Rhodoferax sp. WC2427 TaxID=3234144 RepID=UPI003466E313
MRIPPIFWLACLLLCAPAHAATALHPSRGDEVVERLPTITRVRPAAMATATATADPAAAAAQARAHIATARQTGDTRYWGRAQAVLAPWWDKPDAPVDMAILQATVQQGRHDFKAARSLLQAAVHRAPQHAQGWLNLAALERLSGRYDQALRACEAVARAGQNLYALACQLETQSLQGQSAAARTGFTRLLAATQDPAQTSWLQSLLAESEERAGRDAAARTAYQRSLQAAPDLYTSIALSDLLLRTGHTAQALAVLQPLPQTDAVLLRQATALRRLNNPEWKTLRATLGEWNAELARRGDDLSLHSREQALVALWLDDDAPGALQIARRNLELQREPIDWWVALQSARQAQDTAAVQQLQKDMQQVGIVDARSRP